MVRIRLTRLGAKKKPFYRIVAAEKRRARDGKFLEVLGYYDPVKRPHELKFDEAKIKEWLSKGAKPSNTVKKLIGLEKWEA
ncbi:MAG: 30S ribosomal protein S16 [Candidatus Mycalebacterium zealandia]|nr:MAG: 30S ribosomal protein S16 [Candidatus Mycalebacterium zealandia]